jgi:hypothetical protein
MTPGNLSRWDKVPIPAAEMLKDELVSSGSHLMRPFIL